MAGLVHFFNKIKSWNPYSRVSDLQKKVDHLRNVMRPVSSPAGRRGFGVIHSYPYHPDTIVDLCDASDVMRTITNSLKREMFRNGFSVVEADKTDSGVSTGEDDVDVSGQEEIRTWLLDKVKRINRNKQSIKELSEELEDDLNKLDDAFLLSIMEYGFSASGEIVKKEFVEALRLNPRQTFLVINDQDLPGYDDQGRRVMFCPVHRDKAHYDVDVCQCGKKMVPAHFVHRMGSTETYYSEGEVCHVSKYSPSKRYGYPAPLSVWMKIRTLMAQDRYILDIYEGQRSPNGLLLLNTTNPTGAKAAWDEVKEQANEDPHYPAIMAVNPGMNSGGKDIAKFVDFMKDMNELQYTEQRKEFWTKIGAVYGVMPIFQADVSSGGGLNNEGMQITVTNRAVEYGQSLYNEKFFPFLLESMQVEGWVLLVNPSEEADEIHRLEIQGKSLENARLAVELGLDCVYDEDAGKVVISGGKVVKPEGGFGQDGFGGSDEGSDMRSGEPSGVDSGGNSDFLRPTVKSLLKKKDKFDFVKVGLIYLGDRKPPEGAEIVIGPEGGKYIKIKGSGDYEDESSDSESGSSEDSELSLPDHEIGVEGNSYIVNFEALSGSGYMRKIKLNKQFLKGEGGFTKESYDKILEGLAPHEIGAKVVFAKNRGFGCNGFVIFGNEKQEIFVANNGNLKEGNGYTVQRESFVKYAERKGVNKDYVDALKNVTDEDQAVGTTIHEWGHLLTEKKIGNYMSHPMFFDAIVQKFPELGNYIDLAKDALLIHGKKDSNSAIGEMIAEDFRIESCRRMGNPDYLMLNSYSYSYDVDNLDDAEKRQKMIYEFLKGDEKSETKKTILNPYTKRIKSLKLWKKESEELKKKELLSDVDKSSESATRGFTKLADLIKKEVEKFVKIWKRLPSEKEMRKTLERMSRTLRYELEASAASHFKSVYSNEMEKVGKDLGINLTWGSRDDQVLSMLVSQPVLSKAFKTLSDNLSGKVNEIITQAYRVGNVSVQSITESLKEAVGVSDSQAERIARTETVKVASAARRNSYLKEDNNDEFRYRWVGPDDHRTTVTSKRIKKRVGGGVGWNELIQIVKEESSKDFPEWVVNPEFPVSHYNSRHTFVRAV